MLVVFELSMPKRASWDGKWSGDGKPLYVIRNIQPSLANQIVDRYYKYDFGDGWMAEVYVTRIAGKHAEHIRRITEGFHGYEWMIESIIKYGNIRTGS